MATTIASILPSPPTSTAIIPKPNILFPQTITSYSSYTNPYKATLKRSNLITKTKAGLGRSTTTPKDQSSTEENKHSNEDEKVELIHSIAQFDEALISAKNKLVVVEFAASHSYHSRTIYPFMVNLSKTCNDVKFLLVMGDESDEMQQLCKRENITQVPHFTFYKNAAKIHEEEGIGPDELVGDVLYYGDNHSAVVQLHSRTDVETLIEQHKTDHKLIVLDVGLKHCGPCVKVYPTVIKLSRQMTDTVVFARMNGDENESCMEFLKEMNVIEVPTFVFMRDGDVKGRYVGSGKGELIGEILRYQGVRVT